jgi:hypothetical protein
MKCDTGYKPYYTYAQAEMVHEFMLRKKGADREKIRKLRIFECDFCLKYHIGKLDYSSSPGNN